MVTFTFAIGGLPAGLWLVLAFILFSLLFGIGPQALSIIAWNKALAWGLQEDEPNSNDPMQRAFFTIEWGVALADVVVQSVAIVMALYGLMLQHWIGLVGGTVLFTILVYWPAAMRSSYGGSVIGHAGAVPLSSSSLLPRR